MQTLTNKIKMLQVGGKVEAKSLLNFAAQIDNERAATIELLKKLEKNVGMYLGEEINRHLALMDGGRFNEVAYNYERPVGDQ